MAETDYSIELEAPDISAYKAGNTGVDYITTFDSGKPGPHVMLSAVVHGNELCGAITLDFLFRQQIRPLRGRLTLGFMNVAAFHNFQPKSPATSRFVDEDFNRVWTRDVLEGARDSVELRRAREVRPIVDQVDYLLDIHSMQHATVPLMMCGPLEKGMQLARDIGFPRHIVSDVGHAAGKRMRDYAGFGDPASSRNALLVECGQHWQAASAEVAKETALRFLKHCDIVDPDFIAAHLTSDTLPPAQLIQVTEAVTISGNEFQFADNYIGMEIIGQAGTVIGWDDTREVRTPYDNCVLIMPSKRLYQGQTAVRLGRIID
jgi:predicted deacylase